VASWQGDATPLNFGLSENLLVEKISSKNATFGAEPPSPVWVNIGAKLKCLVKNCMGVDLHQKVGGGTKSENYWFKKPIF